MLADGQAMQQGPEVKEASPGGDPTAEMLASRKGYQRAGDQNITEGLHQGQLCGSPRWGAGSRNHISGEAVKVARAGLAGPKGHIQDFDPDYRLPLSPMANAAQTKPPHWPGLGPTNQHQTAAKLMLAFWALLLIYGLMPSDKF